MVCTETVTPLLGTTIGSLLHGQADLRRGWDEAETDSLRAAGSGTRGRQRDDSDDDASPPRCASFLEVSAVV